MENNSIYLKEQLREARRYVEREREQLQEQMETQNMYLTLLEQYDSLLEENERLQSELEQQKAGFVDEHYQLLPTTTRKQAMYIADVFSDKLQMRSKWKPFQELWHINNLAQEKWEMQETGKMPACSEIIDKIFAD